MSGAGMSVYSLPTIEAATNPDRHDDPIENADVAAIVSLIDEQPIPVGFIRKQRGLWRTAAMALSTDDGLIEAHGMPAIIDTIQARSPNGRVTIVLPLHPGYLGVYGDKGVVVARVMATAEGKYAMRRFDPHQSVVCDTVEEALSAALNMAA